MSPLTPAAHTGQNRPVDLALTLVAIAATVILIARLCEPIGVPAPLALLGVGVAASYVPGLPEVSMSPEVVLFGLLPPLLYAAALNTSLIDLRRLLTPILGLSVGLVLFTALGVAIVASWLLPINFAVAFALGAIALPRTRSRLPPSPAASACPAGRRPSSKASPCSMMRRPWSRCARPSRRRVSPLVPDTRAR
ncbi:cation:proton antiporter [Nostocoides veronense]|uniref:cation:proton antiporter domain-containing protein n=1 Tax=Nostocoides veronense TaxID=330836 RepID=UPI0031DCCEB0